MVSSFQPLPIIWRIALLLFVLYATHLKLSYGILACFIAVCIWNQTSLVEGLENGQPQPKPNTNANANTTTTTTSQDHLTATVKAALQDDDEDQNQGIDKESVTIALAAKPSNSIPIDVTIKGSQEVNASNSSDLTGTSASLTEGFCPCAAAV